MSEEKNIPNEEELWDLLKEPVSETPKAVKTEAPKAPETPKSPRKIDGFFLACMAGVAAVSVALTLVVSGMLGSGGERVYSGTNVPEGESYNKVLEQQTKDLKLENAELRAQLEQQKAQIKDLQNDLLSLIGSEEYFATASTDPNENNDVLSAQIEALEIYAAIQEAYADFDRDKLEELIPEMDARLTYLTPEMLNNYYLILEYVEQPSNG